MYSYGCGRRSLTTPYEHSMPKPLLVLIVEDSQSDALLLVEALREAGYAPEYRRVETCEHMGSALQ